MKFAKESTCIKLPEEGMLMKFKNWKNNKEDHIVYTKIPNVARNRGTIIIEHMSIFRSRLHVNVSAPLTTRRISIGDMYERIVLCS